MDLAEHIQPLLDDAQVAIVEATVHLLTAAAIRRLKAKAEGRRCRRDRKRSVWVREWLLMRPSFGQYEQLMRHLAEGDVKSFKNFVRMDPDTFNQLVRDLTPRLRKRSTNCRDPLCPGLKVAITLRYLASGNSYKSLAYGFRVAANTIVKVVPEVCQAIYDNYHETAFKCPTNAVDWKEVATGFTNKWNFHHCCGCIDGKHVRIQAPPHSGSQFYNYKGFYSVIMLAVVDANYKFMYVDVGAFGADSDAGIFKECGLYRALDNDFAGLPPSEPLPDGDTNIPYFLVGDDAFGLRSWMMKPHSKRELTSGQRIFNYRLSRARRIVENAFGILANR